MLLTGDDAFTWYGSLGRAGFDRARVIAEPPGEQLSTRLVFANADHDLYLADMSGDGIADLVRIRNGRVGYWPGLGHGRFGAEVVLANSPWFDQPERFDQSRIRLADFHGTGSTDILYLGADGLRLYLNQSGNRLTDARPLRGLPPSANPAAVAPADLFGNGTACLVWSSPLPGDARRPMRYLDLLGGTKPFLLTRTANNLGAETELEYAASTTFYLADREAGRPWVTRLPFPVHVLTRVTSRDRVSRNELVTLLRLPPRLLRRPRTRVPRLRDGRAMGRRDDPGPRHRLAPVRTRTWFHTGYFAGRDHVSDYYAGLLDATDAGEYFREPGLTDDEARALLLPDTLLPPGLTLDEEREACRALRGSMLRQEVYADDDTPRAGVPYTVTEQNLTVEVLQRRGPNRHAVFFTHPREAISYHYERDPADPRTTHELTLTVDGYGNVLRSATVGYGRRAPNPALPPADQALQGRALVTYTETDVTNAVDTADDQRNPAPCETRQYELTGAVTTAGLVGFDTLLAVTAAATPLDYEQTPTAGQAQKRLIERVRTLYRGDDRAGPLPPGTVESRGLPYEAHRLAFTPGLVAGVLGDRVDDDAVLVEAGYLHSEGDPGWWIPSGTLYYSPEPGAPPVVELAYALEHFFLPQRSRTPFHTAAASTESFVHYDRYDLLVEETRDALGNRTTAGERATDPDQPLARPGSDYRVLQPVLIMDPNRNRAAASFDALGLVAGTALMGKPEAVPAEGDLLADSFRADLTANDIAAFFAAPDGPSAAALLDQATTRIVYDVSAFHRTRTAPRPSPVVAAVLARETHVSDPVPAGSLAIQVSLTYSDGFAREIQHKTQAEPAPGSTTPRWVGSGWTVFNNKGKPVRQFEPFFTDTTAFETDATVGVAPYLFYDPLERVVATLHPDHSWEKAVFDPWHQESWDRNDTVAAADPSSDPDAGAFFAKLPTGDYLPAWAALQTTPAGQRAAAKAAIHAGTPTVAHTDALGRVALVVANNRAAYSDASADSTPADEFQPTRTELDIEGNQRSVTDALGRVVIRYDYDLLGHRIHSSSMEAGQRWILSDVLGKPLYAWDSRDHRLLTGYDVLRRPTESFLRIGGDAEQTVGRTVYGETWPDA